MLSFRILILSVFLVMGCGDGSDTSPGETPAEVEKSRSPFHRPPASVAMDEPCRYIGTFHKESRQRLEILRADKIITLEEWKCMARALADLDDELTVECQKEDKPLAVIESRQTELYTPCLSPPKPKVVACSLLSSEEPCD